jgi:peptidoglycan/xylan/chitin deacetylase (PgdA/CDA1 family)
VSSRQIKRAFFYLARALGAFGLSRYLTRHRLRILGYHGFSIADEYRCLPDMFMRRETFGRRMATLQRLGLPVISLDDAVDRLRTNRIANAEVVITLDDGWASNLSIAYPILKEHRYPATIYVTTEHLGNGTEVFNTVLWYLFLSSTRSSVRLSGVHPRIDRTYDVKPDPVPAVASIISTATQHLSFAERQASLGKIAAAFDVDIATVLKGGRFRLLTSEEMRDLTRKGIAIELHTHAHHLPTESAEAVSADIAQNRNAVEAATGTHPRHFCYPSGRYNAAQAEWLSAIGIRSATTCDPTLNDATTNPMLLGRYLDQEDLSDIEFEAAVTGFRHLLRRFLK